MDISAYDHRSCVSQMLRKESKTLEINFLTDFSKRSLQEERFGGHTYMCNYCAPINSGAVHTRQLLLGAVSLCVPATAAV